MSNATETPRGAETRRRPLHLLAVIVLGATFLMIVTGGNITSHGGAPAVTGSWLPSLQSFNPADYRGIPYVQDEHAHLLLGAATWVLVTALVVLAWRQDPRSLVARLAVLAWLGVLVQALMGWLRISQLSTAAALTHGLIAHAFLCLTVALATLTSPRWQDPTREDPSSSTFRLRAASAALVVTLLAQFLSGAILRQTGWGMLVHIAGSIAVGLCLTIAAHQIYMHGIAPQRFRRSLNLLFGLFGAEVALGTTTILAIRAMETTVPMTRTQAFLPTIHLALGAIMLAVAFRMTMRVFHLPQAEAAKASENSSGSHVAVS